MLTFAATGIAGYVFPRHLRAIEECEGKLVVGYDPFDSVGFLDAHSMECGFFKDFKSFSKECLYVQPDYFVICSPNHVHFEQCLAGLRNRANVICEKPVVLTYNDICRLKDCEAETGRKVFTILQSRLKPELISLRDQITSGHKVHLLYHTPRGRWYNQTWKADVRKSGGLETNIGVHMFDLLLWFFGDEFRRVRLSTRKPYRVIGEFETPKAQISFDLSVEPFNSVKREIVIDGERIDFTGGFTNLHTESYKQIMAGQGFTLDDAAPSIKLCERLRRM